MASWRDLSRSPWVLLSTAGLAGLLAYLLIRKAIEPDFTDYWGFIVVQTGGTLALMLALSMWLGPRGGLSWYTHLVVTANTWADALGTAGHLYERYTGYDKVTHFLAGVALTTAAADILRALDDRGVIRLALARRLVAAMFLTLVINVGWEAYEYIGDAVFHSERHRGSLDTAYDFIADTSGALVAALLVSIIASGRLAAVRRPISLGRTYSLGVEMGIVALTFLVWQILRIPFEGSRREALSHAGDWLAAERALHVDIEPALIRFVHEHAEVHDLASVAYSNLHVPVVIGLLAAARLRSPRRYPKLRTTFVLAHIPALAVLAAYPLAPPHWLTTMPFAGGPPADLTDLRNATAAAVSLHFGYALFVAGAALWLRPRAPLAWSALLYPPFIFAVILGTGNHYVLDTLVGAACIVLAAGGAHLIHGHAPRDEPAVTPARPGRAALVALAAALAGFLANGLATGELDPPAA